MQTIGTPLSAGIYVSASRGVCRECRQIVDARYVADDDGVYLERWCPAHGPSRALVAESLAWYLDALQFPIAARPPARAAVDRGACSCPDACGPCQFHAQRCHLPVFSITNACDLRCPICFTYNRADQKWFMSAEDFRRHIDFVIEATGSVDLVNLTGGEPTLHPELGALIKEAQRPEIGRVTVNSNGLRLAREPDLARMLSDLGAYVILSLDSLDPERCRRLHGRDISDLKRRALENLERFDIPTTLLMVLVGGVNEDELGDMLRLVLEKDFIRSLTIQTMTYTGQGGGQFEPRQHIPVDGVERRIEEASGGRIRQADFTPLPTAHPLCYGATYLLMDDEGTPHPFVRALSRDVLVEHLSEGYLLHPSDRLEQDLRQAVDRMWSEGSDPGLLRAIKQLLAYLYPPGEAPLDVHERQRRAERGVKTIYVHAHMDEDTWEAGRAVRCPDQVPVDAERFIGACNYNLFYRMHDKRFWVTR